MVGTGWGMQKLGRWGGFKRRKTSEGKGGFLWIEMC